MSGDPMKTRLSRRQALGALGTVGLGGLLAACGDTENGASRNAQTHDGATATVEPKPTSGATDTRFDESARCVVTPEQTAGPFYFDADKIRRDIREDREGMTLRLALRVRDAGSCDPLQDAVIDIWHADAGGAYSGFDNGAGGAPTDTRYLRGAQVTNAEGVVELTTIYPGWYPGRAPHIHVKVHIEANTVLTTQLYFDDALSGRVYATPPYSARGTGHQRNGSDALFDPALVMTTRREGDAVRGVMTIDVRKS